MPNKAPILNVPRSIREDIPGHYDLKENSPCSKDRDHAIDDDDDLIFGALDEEESPKEILDQRSLSTDEGIHLNSESDHPTVVKRERATSSMSTVDDEWDHILPITDGEGPVPTVHHLQSIQEKNVVEPIIGMSNFRAKHRLRRRSKITTLGRWKEAVKKVVKLKDPW